MRHRRAARGSRVSRLIPFNSPLLGAPQSGPIIDEQHSAPAIGRRPVSRNVATPSGWDRDDREMSSRFLVHNRHNVPIESREDWRQLASPASPIHWKDGRSAMELAKAWIGGAGQAALARLLEMHPETKDLVIDDAIAEAQVSFDRYPGGKRNHDLLIHGHCRSGDVVIGLEAKADEPFGQTVGQYEAKAQATRRAGITTNAPERIAELMTAVLGPSAAGVPTMRDLRYQLFTGIAGTLAAAEDAELAVFVIHEFATPATDASKAGR